MIQRLYIVLFILPGIIFYNSCQKKFLCPDCENNKPPVAHAGPDQKITLPKDSVILDGSTSSDPDGNLTSFKWIKIAGPATFTIKTETSKSTIVKGLAGGIYQFELTVTDDGGLSAKDTVQVIVDAPGNQPPVACAGADQTITLPANSITLNGSCSADPDNNIINYSWTKISGPSSANIANASLVQTQVMGLIQGIYEFELKVTDAGGLFTRDTIQVTVLMACNETNRTRVNAQLIPVGSLSMRRGGLNIASAGSKVVFAGGSSGSVACPECWGTPQVDIYDTITQLWSTARLSVGRWGIAAITAGNKIFFAGGEFGDGAHDTYYSNVDIYDAATDTWSVSNLSEPRSDIAAAQVGNKVIFAGGEYNWNYDCSGTVDIYDLSTNRWSTSALSSPRAFVATACINNKVYFAGGTSQNRWLTPSAVIDIYDNSTNTWTTSSLQSVDGLIAGTSVANKAYWSISCTLEILNVSTGSSSLTNLSRPLERWFPVYGRNVLTKGTRLIFLHDYNNVTFDIYDTISGTWSVGVLPYPIHVEAVISVNNTLYVTDGLQVWKLEF